MYTTRNICLTDAERAALKNAIELLGLAEVTNRIDGLCPATVKAATVPGRYLQANTGSRVRAFLCEYEGEAAEAAEAAKPAMVKSRRVFVVYEIAY